MTHNQHFHDTGGGQYPSPNIPPRDVAKRAPVEPEPTMEDLIVALRAVVDAQIDIDLDRVHDCLQREAALDHASKLLARLP